MKNKLNNLIALSIGLFTSILIIEAVLHFYNPFGFRQKGDRIILPANFEMVYKNETIVGLDSIISHSKNSLGFRGPEKPNDFKNWTSIISVGGSTTECFYISDGKDWPSLLESKLDNKFNNIWMNNAGLDGHSTFGHQILLKDHLVKMKPNYIIFLIGRNDIGRKDLNSFDRSNLKTNTNWKAFLRNNSEFVSLIVNLNRSLNARKMKLGHSGVEFQELDFVDSIHLEKMNKIIEHHKEFTDAFENRLKGIVSITKENDIIPILVTQPTIVGTGFDKTTGLDLEKVKFCHSLGGKVYWKILETYNEITKKVAENENVLLIDLAQKMPKSTELFYDCAHFTNRGAEVVSQIIYDDMKNILLSK